MLRQILPKAALALIGLAVILPSASAASPASKFGFAAYQAPLPPTPPPACKVGFGAQLGVGLAQYAQPKCWIAGQWVTEAQRVWQPGTTKRVWVPPVYRTVIGPCGTPRSILVQPGHFRTVTEPGCWTVKRVKVWKPGHWA